jgi:hypothetical protein
VQHGTTAWISGRCSCATHDDVSYDAVAAKRRLSRMRAAMWIMKVGRGSADDPGICLVITATDLFGLALAGQATAFPAGDPETTGLRAALAAFEDSAAASELLITLGTVNREDS